MGHETTLMTSHPEDIVTTGLLSALSVEKVARDQARTVLWYRLHYLIGIWYGVSDADSAESWMR